MRVVEAKFIQTSRDAYNVLRSFVESSMKDQYTWNVGVLREDFVEFIKPGKWRVVITAEKAQLISLKTYKVVAELDKKLLIEQHEFDTSDIAELVRTFVAPEEPVPYATPIRVLDVFEKLLKYYFIARDHLATKVAEAVATA
jgi:hypothetical protein